MKTHKCEYLTAVGAKPATGKKVPPRARTQGGGGLPRTMPPVAFDRYSTTFVRLDPHGHRRLALRFARAFSRHVISPR